MSLLQKLTEDMKTAMRAKEKERLTTLRGLIAEIKRMELDSKKTLTEDEEIAFLTTQAKRRREAIEAFQTERPELAAKEQTELELITHYLPEQLSDDEAREILKEIIVAVGATSPKDLGKVMGKAMQELKGRYPGGEVRALVAQLLND